MRGIKTKNNGKRKQICIFFVLLALFGVLVNSVRKVYDKKIEAQVALGRMEGKFQELENRREFLANSLQMLETEEGIKIEMRKKLNVAEAGESVAIIVNEENAPAEIKLQISGWQKFKKFFTNLFSD